MSQASNVYRRPSGIYAIRLVVPTTLRDALGKGEIHVSTGSRTPAVAKAVANALLAHWREKFLSLARLTRMDLERVATGSPLLLGGGKLRLAEASDASGLGEDELLREASDGRVQLYVRTPGLWGRYSASESIDEQGESSTGSFISEEQHFVGLLRVRNVREVSSTLLSAPSCDVRVLDQASQSPLVFVADGLVRLTRAMLELDAAEVEAVRLLTKPRVSDAQIQLEASRAHGSPRSTRKKAQRRTSEALIAFMDDKSLRCAEDHARRVRSACQLFVELEGDPKLAEIDRDRMRHFVGVRLKTLPAQAHKAMQEHGASVPDSWPRLSIAEQKFRAMCLADMFAWLETEGWIDDNPCEGLKHLIQSDGARRRTAAQRDARDPFSESHISKIFAMHWFASGRGELTSEGTYREFLPFYYWLPLLGLFTGARINELSQLHLSDIRRTEAGVWYIEIYEGELDQKLKNPNSTRLIPIHPLLISLGLVSWAARLRAEGYDRLFPELRHDKIKGYGKDSSRWFSRLLGSFGWVRNGRLVFHSFRHTFITVCVNKLSLYDATISQLTGHARGTSTLMNTYRKDVLPDELLPVVERVDFALPVIAPFDQDEGMRAVRDALDRKEALRKR